MRVVRILENDRVWNSQKLGTQHVHRIYFDTDKGAEYPAELVTGSPKQNTFREGETCCFRVTNEQRREIERCPSPEEMKAQSDDDAYSPSPVNVAGRSYNFALAYAKDLLVAAIRGGHVDYEDPLLLERMKQHAWDMHQWLMDPKPESSNQDQTHLYTPNTTNEKLF